MHKLLELLVVILAILVLTAAPVISSYLAGSFYYGTFSILLWPNDGTGWRGWTAFMLQFWLPVAFAVIAFHMCKKGKWHVW